VYEFARTYVCMPTVYYMFHHPILFDVSWIRATVTNDLLPRSVLIFTQNTVIIFFQWFSYNKHIRIQSYYTIFSPFKNIFFRPPIFCSSYTDNRQYACTIQAATTLIHNAYQLYVWGPDRRYNMVVAILPPETK